jgi:hypothetical protein
MKKFTACIKKVKERAELYLFIRCAFIARYKIELSFFLIFKQIKSRITMAKAAFNRKKIPTTSKLDLNLWKKRVKCYIWSIALYGAETYTLESRSEIPGKL